MPFLHIEHPITDLKSWVSAFAGFTETRRQAGVTAETVRRPEGDDAFVVIDLEFDTTEPGSHLLALPRDADLGRGRKRTCAGR